MGNIGKYEIESKIGHGGMGDVYRAFDPTVRRYVAIKVLKVEGDADLLNRFHLEATAAGNLNHPNIVTIHDYGEHEGQPYLVMEFLEGQDLQRSIDAGRKFDLVEIADFMAQVADALECAHQHGVIHRDIKPANIMLLNRGGVKLMDFGIARLTGANTQQTKTGYLIGTPLYMSPEQFQNKELDARVDIWAYGLIYYQLLANKHPFQVPDQLATMYNIAHTPAPPICALNCEVPEALGQIVDKCLVKDRDQRFRTMEDLRFEAFPVLQDLTKQQAARMVGEARNLMTAGELEAAQAMVRRVLDLDPGDRSAHTLRKSIAEEIQRKSVRPQLESLCASAEQQMASHQYAKALELFEAALRLDTTLASARKRAGEARELLEREKRAGELLELAQREMNANNLAGARQNATELLRVHPEHSEGARLLESIQSEIEKSERQARLDAGLTSARNLVRGRSFEEAVSAISELLAEFPGTSELSQLLRDAESGRDRELLRKRQQRELGNAKELLKLRRFEEAVRALEPLTLEFPHEAEFGQLLTYAREEWTVQQRAEALERLKRHVAQLQAEGRFQEAMRFLDRSLVEFPDDPELLRLHQLIGAAKAETERREAIEEVALQISAKQRAGDFAEALRVADAALRHFGPDDRLRGLREQVDRDWQTMQRNAALAQAIGEARTLVERREWTHAISHLRQGLKNFPGEADLKALLDQAEQALHREEREHAEQNALAQAAALEAQNQPEAALAALEFALRQYPDSAALSQPKRRLQRQLEEARQAREREAKLEEARRKALEEQDRRNREMDRSAQAINDAVAARNFTQALKLARAAAKEFAGEGRFSELPGEIESLQRDAKVEEAIANAYAAIGRGEIEKAEKLLADARKIDANHPGLSDVAGDLAKERARKAELKRITHVPETSVRRAGTITEEPARSFPVKWVAGGGLAALALLAAAFFAFKPTPSPTPVPPPAAAFSFPKQPVEWTFTEGGRAPRPLELPLAGPVGMAFHVKPSDPWIQVSPQDGILPAKVMLSAKTSGLTAGPHDASVELQAGTSTGSIPVKLTVNERPAAPPPTASSQPVSVTINPEAFAFEYQQGGPDPSPRTIYISGSEASVAFEVSARDRWVSIAPLRGSAPARIAVAVHPGSLLPGRHTSQVTITTGTAQPPQKVVYISVTVSSPPSIPPPSAPPKLDDKTTAPVVTQLPTTQPPITPPPAVQPPTGSPGVYTGRRSGSLTWTGTLAPGGKVVISADGLVESSGRLQGPRFPQSRELTAAISSTPGVKAAFAGGKITLTNASPAPLLYIEVTWKVQ